MCCQGKDPRVVHFLTQLRILFLLCPRHDPSVCLSVPWHSCPRHAAVPWESNCIRQGAYRLAAPWAITCFYSYKCSQFTSSTIRRPAMAVTSLLFLPMIATVAFKYDKTATVNWLGLNGWPANSMQLVHIEQQHYIKPSNDRLTTKSHTHDTGILKQSVQCVSKSTLSACSKYDMGLSKSVHIIANQSSKLFCDTNVYQ